jgi:hypothetical protein
MATVQEFCPWSAPWDDAQVSCLLRRRVSETSRSGCVRCHTPAIIAHPGTPSGLLASTSGGVVQKRVTVAAELTLPGRVTAPWRFQVRCEMDRCGLPKLGFGHSRGVAGDLYQAVHSAAEHFVDV